MDRPARWTRLCWACGRWFPTIRNDAKFCGPTCRQRWHRSDVDARAEVRRLALKLSEGGLDSQQMLAMAIEQLAGPRTRGQAGEAV